METWFVSYKARYFLLCVHEVRGGGSATYVRVEGDQRTASNVILERASHFLLWI